MRAETLEVLENAGFTTSQALAIGRAIEIELRRHRISRDARNARDAQALVELSEYTVIPLLRSIRSAQTSAREDCREIKARLASLETAVAALRET